MKVIVCPYCHKEIEVTDERRMSRPERWLEKFIVKHKLPFKFVGNDRKFKIAGHTPDFISTNGSLRVIEVFGCMLHHEDEEQELQEEYAKEGFKLLVLWDYQLIKIKNNKFIYQDKQIDTGQLYFMIRDF